MIPLYGFVDGDCMGLVVLADEQETAGALAERLQASAGPRVAPRARLALVWQGQVVDPALTVARAGFAPLDRIDLQVTPEVER